MEQFLDKYSIEEIVNKTAIVNIREINETLNHLGELQQLHKLIQKFPFMHVTYYTETYWIFGKFPHLG